MKKKGLAMVLALVLLAVCAVSGTLAWLTAKSDTVVNTFTTSDIEVKLEETLGTTVADGKEYQMIPGHTLGKDPKAWVVDGSVDCFLFVKLEKSANFDNYLTYVMADGWTLVPGETNVYYREVTSTEMGTSHKFDIIKDNQVTVKGTVTKADMNALDAEGAVKPTLTITAYASQLYKTNGVEFSAADAWANVGVTP